jgi:hypothetical protein
MAIYSLALRTGTLNNQVSWELQTGSTDAIRVLEIGLAVQSAGGRNIGLGRPTSLGVGATTVSFLAEDFDSPEGTTTAAVVCWTSLPGSPTNFLRRASSNTTTSNGMVIWRFPEGLVVPINSNLAIFNIGAGFADDIWCVIDE